jgi:hypothetical protein
MKPALDFGTSPFLHLIGQLKVPKQKAAQNRGNEIRVRSVVTVVIPWEREDLSRESCRRAKIR